MSILNSLYVLPHNSTKNGIIVYDNLQAQEIMRLNNIEFNTIYNITKEIRKDSFIFTSSDPDKIKKWYLITKDNSYNTILHFIDKYSTNISLNDIEHFWLCPYCMCAVPDIWNKCTICNNKNYK